MGFRIRGYYVIPSRNQFWGLDEWKKYVDCAVEDDCNFLIFWIAGSFRSAKYPETWSYNKAHRNIEENFYPAVIDYARSQGLEVVLGFTPYAYDGVASYASEHPELAGRNPDGSIHRVKGIHDAGLWLCPAHTESREFMLEYVREMYFGFHPNADGLFIESSDYGHCQCPDCREHYMEREWEFVRRISEEVWAKNPCARLVIYPLYNQQGIARPDERFTLIFTPHSAHITQDVIRIPCDKIYWEGVSFSKFNTVRRGARIAKENGMDGYVVAMETFGYTDDQGGRSVTYQPFDVPWSTVQFPMEDLVPSVLRFSYNFYSNHPAAEEEEYRGALAKRFFGSKEVDHGAVRDLLYLCSILQESFQHFGRRSSLVHPEDFEFQYPPGSDKRAEAENRFKEAVSRFDCIAQSYADHEMGRIARWIVDRWREIHPEIIG
ncbi:MAG: hypothetical protein ACUVRS_11705 [Armatimonadota bacterium]